MVKTQQIKIAATGNSITVSIQSLVEMTRQRGIDPCTLEFASPDGVAVD